MSLTWYVTVVQNGRAAPAERFATKRAALARIAALGELSSITRSVVPGGRSYVVAPKSKS